MKMKYDEGRLKVKGYAPPS
jgi:hypothetical protein